MTKRDFDLIARIIREVGDDGVLCMDDVDDRITLAHQFASALEKTNPRFDSDRFIAAAVSGEDKEEAYG